MKKILIIMPHFAPYRDDTFKYIESEGDYQIKFLITTGNTTHNEWDYENRDFDYIQSKQGKNYGSFGVLYDELKKSLKSFKPDVVITCGNLITVLYVKIKYKTTKVIYCSDQIKSGKNSKSIFNKLILKFFYNLADGIWTTGKAGELYFKNYMKNSLKIKQGCYTNDNNRILKASEKYNRERERLNLGIPLDSYVFLFVGKLTKNRKIENLLKLAHYYEKENKDVRFLIVGDGPEQNLIPDVKENIIHIPRITLKELEKVYVVSDAYLYLGWEPYSLALYEAAILGLPIIANEEIGAVYDCVDNGVNGVKLKLECKNCILDACNDAIDRKFDDGAKKKQEFIFSMRGINWAGKQLMELVD